MEEKEILDSIENKDAAEEVVLAAEAKETSVAPQETPAESEEAKDEKPMSKKKRILNAILLAVQILMVVLAITITLVVIINPKDNEVSSAGVKLLPVLSDSMDGERTLVVDGEEKTFKGFPTGALVIAKGPRADGNYQVGDIITFEFVKDGELKLDTHRIVEIVHYEGDPTAYYRTQGDNRDAADLQLQTAGSVKALYVTHINKLGTAIEWVREGYHFIYVIIIPLGLLLIYNIYLVAQIVVEGKMKKAKALAAESAKAAALASIDEEEIKRKAIEEYLKSQAAAAEKGDSDKKGD